MITIGFLVNVLAGVIGAALGAALLQLYKFGSQILPARRLWRLRRPSELILCVATSAKVFTGKHHRPTTGSGQVNAMALISASLRKAYRKAPLTNIVFSHEPIQKKIESDIIVLGGPKNNEIAGRFIDKFGLFDQLPEGFRWKVTGGESFLSEVEDEVVRVDYGVILQGTNPFSTNGTYVALFSGIHTYGTMAAARYFTETYVEEQIVKEPETTLLCLVKCEVVNEFPAKIELVRQHAIAKQHAHC